MREQEGQKSIKRTFMHFLAHHLAYQAVKKQKYYTIFS